MFLYNEGTMMIEDEKGTVIIEADAAPEGDPTLLKIATADSAFQQHNAAETIWKIGEKKEKRPTPSPEAKLGKKIAKARDGASKTADSYYTDPKEGTQREKKLSKLQKLKEDLVAAAETKSEDPETVAVAIAFVEKNIGNSRSWEMANDVIEAFPKILPALARKILGEFSKETDAHGPLSINNPEARKILKLLISRISEIPEDQMNEAEKEEISLWNHQLEGFDFHQNSLEHRKKLLKQTQEGILQTDRVNAPLIEQFTNSLPDDIKDKIGKVELFKLVDLSQTTNAEGSILLLAKVARKIIDQFPDDVKLRQKLEGFVVGAVEGFLLSQSEILDGNEAGKKKKEMRIKAAEMLQDLLGTEISVFDKMREETPISKQIKRVAAEVGGNDTMQVIYVGHTQLKKNVS